MEHLNSHSLTVLPFCDQQKTGAKHGLVGAVKTGTKHGLVGAVAKRMEDDDLTQVTSMSNDDLSARRETSFIAMETQGGSRSEIVALSGAVEVEGPLTPSTIESTTRFVEMEHTGTMSNQDQESSSFAV